MTISNVNAGDPLDPAWGDSIADLLNGATVANYTPTLAGTGWSLGNGTIAGRYVQGMGRVWFALTFTIGSTTGLGAGTLLLGIPVAANATWIQAEGNGFVGSLADVSAPQRYNLTSIIDTTSRFQARVMNASGTYVQPTAVTSTVPVTLATGDIIYYAGSYFHA